jgi:hypothetical protein
VRIDDARRHELSLGVERRGRRAADLPDLDDFAVLDRDICAIAGEAGTVDDHAVLDDQVVRHQYPPRLSGSCSISARLSHINGSFVRSLSWA